MVVVWLLTSAVGSEWWLPAGGCDGQAFLFLSDTEDEIESSHYSPANSHLLGVAFTLGVVAMMPCILLTLSNNRDDTCDANNVPLF